MIRKSPSQDQGNMFLPILKGIVNPEHKLVILSNKIDWGTFENEFNTLYSHMGPSGVPVRLQRNYLKGDIGNDINALLAAAGFNFRGLLSKIKKRNFLVSIFD